MITIVKTIEEVRAQVKASSVMQRCASPPAQT